MQTLAIFQHKSFYSKHKTETKEMSVTVKCHLDTIHRTCLDLSRAALIAHS